MSIRTSLRATLSGAVAIGALLACSGSALASLGPPLPGPLVKCTDECYVDTSYPATLKSWESSFVQWAISSAPQVPQVPATGGAPTVVAKAEGALVEGRLEVVIACAAKSNQLTPAATVITSCYTTNGVTALGNTTPGAAAVTETAAAGTFQAFSVCVSAYSISTSGQASDVKSACAPAVSADANAAQVALVAQ